jgi:hypothetical protein
MNTEQKVRRSACSQPARMSLVLICPTRQAHLETIRESNRNLWAAYGLPVPEDEGDPAGLPG